MITIVTITDRDPMAHHHPEYTPDVVAFAGSPSRAEIVRRLAARWNTEVLNSHEPWADAENGPSADDVPPLVTPDEFDDLMLLSIVRQERPALRVYARDEDGGMWATDAGWASDPLDAKFFPTVAACRERIASARHAYALSWGHKVVLS